VAVVDDEWLMVGSANLNRRGLITDTEMDVQAVAPSVARHLRVRLWAEHLGLAEADVREADPIALIDGPWRQRADEMARHLKAGDAPSGGQVQRYMPGTNPGSRVLDVIQALTLEH
jgi:phosphatidylserine/phosphatidylglycerophosphate/cardiolipin synthase-like enzyme